jgi:DNA-binding response OmpR family regulator
MDDEPEAQLCPPDGDADALALGGRRRRPRVLVAEDRATMRQLLATALRRQGYEVAEFADGAALWGEVRGRLRAANHATPVILITAFGDVATLLEAMRLGASRVFSKPFDLDHLVAAAAVLVERRPAPRAASTPLPGSETE